MSTDLADRYGAPSPWRRRVGVGLAAAVVAVSLGWLAWATWFHSNPEVKSTLIAFNVEGPHSTRATVQVSLGEGVKATCRLRAYAEDHTTVGELAFTPVNGDNEVTIRTERPATTVEKIGCTAPGQKRPQ